MIELKHLGKTYRTSDQEIVALDDINLVIRDGEIFGIIGLSGAGRARWFAASTCWRFRPPVKCWWTAGA